MRTTSVVLSSLALFSLPSLSLAQDDPSARAVAAFEALDIWYNPASGIWNTAGWWHGANCMIVVAKLAKLEPHIKQIALDTFARTYEWAPAWDPKPPDFQRSKDIKPINISDSAVDPNPWIDDYYTHSLWWAQAWISAWDVNPKNNYLELAEGLFQHAARTWPTGCGNGGVSWYVHSRRVNSVANELFLQTAAQLAHRVKDKEMKAYYYDWAKKSWAWFKRSDLINPVTGLVNDGLTEFGCKNDFQQTWTRNQGVLVGGLVELARIDKANVPEYLDAAEGIVKATIKHMTDENLMLRESCEPNCAPDMTQYKGIFIRNLLLLQKVRPRDEYARMIRGAAESIWANDRDEENRLSVQWVGPFVSPVNASTHSSAMDALVAALAL